MLHMMLKSEHGGVSNLLGVKASMKSRYFIQDNKRINFLKSKITQNSHRNQRLKIEKVIDSCATRTNGS